MLGSRLDAIRLTNARGDWIQISHRDFWDTPTEAPPMPEAESAIRATMVGRLARIELFPAHAETAIEVEQPDAASLFQSALRVDEGSSWTIRSSTGGGPAERMAGVTPLRGTSNAWDWSLVDAVGQSVVEWDGIRLPVLVLDRKMPGPDRVQELENLLVDVWRRHHALLRRLSRPTTLQLGNHGYRPRAPIHTLLLLERIVWHDGVHEAWEEIAAEPHSELDLDWPVTPVERSTRPAFHGPHGPWDLAEGWYPGQAHGRIRNRRPVRTTDTPPNRLGVRLAMVVESLLDEVLAALYASKHPSAVHWRTVALQTRNRATRLMAAPQLQDVDAFGALGLETPTVQTNASCRPFLRGWAELQRGLAIDLHIEALLADPLKEAWDLYEYWCWFELCDVVERILRRRGRTVTVKTDLGDAFVGEAILRHGLVHTISSADCVVRIHYNRTAAGKPRAPYWSYSRKFRPDLALEVQTAGNETPDLFLFDAKYRVDVVDVASDDADEDKRSERRGVAKTDDIKVMHGYRDAVRTASGAPARWVLSLYPGTDAVVFVQGSGRRDRWLEALGSRDCGGVGAIPCRPRAGGEASLLEQAMRAILGPLASAARGSLLRVDGEEGEASREAQLA